VERVGTGGCLCGAVRYQVSGLLRPVIICHCRQCQRTHGQAAAYTAAPRPAVVLIEERGLSWYESSPGFRRGFCRSCGASLFWERVAGSNRSIAAGSLDDTSGLVTAGHIHVAEAGGYDTFDDGLPRFEGSDHGALASDAT
jgi:hypothetical protein